MTQTFRDLLERKLAEFRIVPRDLDHDSFYWKSGREVNRRRWL